MSASLTSFNTLSLNQSAKVFIEAHSVAELTQSLLKAKELGLEVLILGGGSNVVFTCDFEGMVIKLSTKGITVEEDKDYISLTVQAGEDWHSFVKFTLNNGYFGLENLALIPGTVGAAPIQNIGAYGVEVNQFCSEVTYLCLETYESKTLAAKDCEFGYRESIFKNSLKDTAVITTVKFVLPKKWHPNLRYGPLQHLDTKTVLAKDIYTAVCEVRNSKLPDPNKLGNVGSFFKNPVVPAEQYLSLLTQYSDLVGYAQSDGRIKIAAGWLIDEAGLKGHTVGRASVHEKQALVLVNLDHATGDDICQLAHYVIDTVDAKFGIRLEAEPRIIGAHGEVTL